MLRVTLEILPGGDPARMCEVGRLEICNMDCTEAPTYCWDMFHNGKRFKSGITARHKRKSGAWSLLRKVLLGMNLRELPIGHQEAAPEASKD